MTEHVFRVGPGDVPPPPQVPENAGPCHECGGSAWRVDTFADGRPSLVCTRCGHVRRWPRRAGAA